MVKNIGASPLLFCNLLDGKLHIGQWSIASPCIKLRFTDSQCFSFGLFDVGDVPTLDGETVGCVRFS